MSKNMVERVARAIRDEARNWERDMRDNGDDEWAFIARAAIEAMREPTEEMIDVSFNNSSKSFERREGRPPSPEEDSAEQWRMMIDAALKP